MHPSALNFGKLFFETYCAGREGAVVYDIGAQDVNGSLKDVLPPHLSYVGVDFVAGNGVDVVLDDPYKLPFADASLDIVVCSSCFEHSQFHWLVFLEILRVLKPDGLLYLNVPSNGSIHRYPVDCWRFYPDAGRALEAWASHNGYRTLLTESFVGQRSPDTYESGGAWHDFVAVFVKDRQHADAYPRRMLDALDDYSNGFDSRSGLESRAGFLSPDHVALVDAEGTIAALRAQQAESEERLVALQASHDEVARGARELRLALEQRDTHIGQRDQELARRDEQIGQRDMQLAQRDEQVARRDQRIDALMAQIVAQHEQLQSLKRLNQQLELERDSMRRQLEEHAGVLATLRQELADGSSRMQQTHHEDEVHLRAALDRIEELLQSRSWRATAPARRLMAVARLARAKLRRLASRLQGGSAGAEAADAETIRASGQFDEEFYRAANPDLPATLDVIAHYCAHGWREWRDPSPRFSTRYYLETNADIREAGVNPFAHYLRAGAAELRKPHPDALLPIDPGAQGAPAEALGPQGEASGPGQLASEVAAIRESGLFDEAWYRSRYPDLASVVDPVQHYCAHGWREGRNPSAAFDTLFYLATSPDIKEAGMNPLLHYVLAGAAEGRPAHPGETASRDEARVAIEVEAIRASGQFDEAFYRAMNPDIDPAPADAIRHYCERGWREGRNPCDDFSTEAYLAAYKDIREAGINPFWHYVVAGASELRRPDPRAVVHYEDNIRFGRLDTDAMLLAFHATPDWTAVRGSRVQASGDTQPLLPHSVAGFYAATDGATLQRQAALARSHGVQGFCFPVRLEAGGELGLGALGAFLDQQDVDIRFCLALDGAAATSPAAGPLMDRAFGDSRALRVHGRVVVLLKPADSGAGVQDELGRLRRLLESQARGPVYLIACWTEGDGQAIADACAVGACDAVLDLPEPLVPRETGAYRLLESGGILSAPYSVVAAQGAARAHASRRSVFPLYQTVTVGRDSTAAGEPCPLVYKRFQPGQYRRWLDAAIEAARTIPQAERRLVFLRSWNDWNRGSVLEPDRSSGYGRLNETSRAILGIASGARMPKVSVIVPNYNHEPFLRQRLDSIYRQTYRNIEVILMDDCSRDGSRAVMDAYAAAHPDITRTLYNEVNSGGAFRQWAKGIKAASGDLVWIAESDDYCDERFLEVLVRRFDDEAVLLACGHSVFVDRDGVGMEQGFREYLWDLEEVERWDQPYVETAHREVRMALGIKNTIPNASGVLFRRPVDMALLDDPDWLSMRVVGDWVFYLHLARGGKIAYDPGATNYFRRYEGSTAESSYRKATFFQEVGRACQAVARLYDVPLSTLERCRASYREHYERLVGNGDEEFDAWFDFDAVMRARSKRLPNVMVSTMGFFPGGAEILPIRLANEFKRQGLSVLLLSTGLNPREDGVRRMLRNDVPLVETGEIEPVKHIIEQFGIEVLNSHQWHVQKYPVQVPDVFARLRSHVATLHGMIEHGNAFSVTEQELRAADRSVGTWVYTADKNLGPFVKFNMVSEDEKRFVKMPNGIQTPRIEPVRRGDLDIPEDAFVLCCVSRAIPDKGWAEAIEAVARARQLSGRDIRLVLVGNGPVYDEYRSVGVPPFVRLVGFSENSAGHYAGADMGIMLTRFRSESFPLTIVDCLFAGKPYIATDVGDIRNMLSSPDGVAGEVIGLEDWQVPVDAAAAAIAAFAGDERRYRKAQERVPRIVSRFRIEAVASLYIDLFRKSASGSGEDAPQDGRLALAAAEA